MAVTDHGPGRVFVIDRPRRRNDDTTVDAVVPARAGGHFSAADVEARRRA